MKSIPAAPEDPKFYFPRVVVGLHPALVTAIDQVPDSGLLRNQDLRGASLVWFGQTNIPALLILATTVPSEESPSTDVLQGFRWYLPGAGDRSVSLKCLNRSG